jgi:hypothetical protein
VGLSETPSGGIVLAESRDRVSPRQGRPNTCIPIPRRASAERLQCHARTAFAGLVPTSVLGVSGPRNGGACCLSVSPLLALAEEVTVVRQSFRRCRTDWPRSRSSCVPGLATTLRTRQKTRGANLPFPLLPRACQESHDRQNVVRNAIPVPYYRGLMLVADVTTPLFDPHPPPALPPPLLLPKPARTSKSTPPIQGSPAPPTLQVRRNGSYLPTSLTRNILLRSRLTPTHHPPWPMAMVRHWRQPWTARYRPRSMGLGP